MKAKSIKGKSTEEIKNALDQSMDDGYKPTMAFVFLTDQEEIDAISAVLDAEGIAIFGASTSEKFTDEGIEPDGIVLLLLDMNPDHFKIVVKDFISAAVYESACQVGAFSKTLFDHPAFIISAADYTIPGEELIKGLLDKAGADVTVIGGMAGEPVHFSGTVFTNHSKSTSGLISLILDEDKIDVKGIAISGWKPIGTEKRITKSEGSWIFTIDNEPAMDVLKKFLGKDIASSERTEGMVPLNINYPLQIQRESGMAMMRPALLWNTADQSVMVGGQIKEGSLFRFSLPPDLDVIDTVIESSREIREKELPDADAMVIFSCVGRLSSLGPMLPSELDGLTATWNKPMVGFFSMGEFGKLDNSRPEFHGTTVCWVALKEK
ncbi:MAG: FIST C-terminal domain-containing protein [Saprospiraceae bacterium]|nr:FIST C-terminal domain-containing protein [Saprospiraceae bacterium]